MAFKRLDGKKVGLGLLAAAALYYLTGLSSGSFDQTDTSDTSGGGEAPPVPVNTPEEATAPVAMPTPEPSSPPPAPAAPQAPPAPAAQPTQGMPAQGMAQQQAPTPATAAATPSGSLKLDNAEPGVIGKSAKWFAGLSPGAQAILAAGTAGGAGALMQSLAMKSAQEDADKRNEMAREDKKRRESIPSFSLGAFRKPGNA
jgi:type IV secretory pathway VirB10-like protein